MNEKMGIIIQDEDDGINYAILLVDSKVKEEEIRSSIEKTKKELAGEWQMSDIIENLPVDFEEVEFYNFYV